MIVLWQLTQYKKHNIFLIFLWQPHADLVYPSVSKKTEIMFQPQPHSSYLPPAATVNSVQVPVTEMFCYLGSRVTRKNTLDDELTARLAKAGAAFGQLVERSWNTTGHKNPGVPNSYSLVSAVWQ